MNADYTHVNTIKKSKYKQTIKYILWQIHQNTNNENILCTVIKMKIRHSQNITAF